MKRNFDLLQYYLKPNVVIFVGDLMDGGRQWNDKDFYEELSRFRNVFRLRDPKTVTLGVAGNHDIGFGETIVPRAYSRYLDHFGKLNSITHIANHSIVALDTIGLSGKPDGKPYQTAHAFLKSLDQPKLNPEKTILISHVPLYRPENADCGPIRHFKPITNRRGYQYQSKRHFTLDLIQYHLTNEILGILKPSLVISGDDHDDCQYTHDRGSFKVFEHSLATFSWLQGNIYPGFGVMSLRPNFAPPSAPGSPSFQLKACPLPPQLHIYMWYIALLIISLIYNTVVAYKRASRKAILPSKAHEVKPFRKIWLLLNGEMIAAALSFYAFIIISKYFNPSQLQERSKLTPSTSKHWKNSQNIDIGLSLTHTKSDKSMINYPVAKRQLPKLSHLSPKPIDIEANPQSTQLSNKINILPKRQLESLLPDLEDDEDLEWISLQRNGIEKMVASNLGDCKMIQINIADAKRTLPEYILFQSATIKHIHDSSSISFVYLEKFKEHINGLYFPTISTAVFDIIQEYLNRNYLAAIKADTSMFSKFEIPCEHILDLMDTALYLDLAKLVDECITKLASEFHHGIPAPLIRSILRLVSIGELVVAEHDLIPKEINNTVEKLSVDVTSVWMDKFWKVMLGWGNIESRWPERLVPSLQTGIISLAKKVCLEFYVSQILMKIAKGASISRKLLFKVLRFEGKELNELVINLEYGYDRLDLNFWRNVFSSCMMLKMVTINCSHINEGLTALLTALGLIYPSIDINLNIVTSDLCEKVLNDISPFCLNPTLTKPKASKIQREHPKHVHMVPENRFNIQGINSLSEYLDRPVKEEQQKKELVSQKTLPISISFVKQKPGYNTLGHLNSISIIQTEYLYPHITKLILKNFCLGLDGANRLAEVLKLGGMLLSLVEIDISNTLITSQGFINILVALVSNKVPLSSKLQKLECSRILFDKDYKNSEAVKVLAQYIGFFAKLDRLGLSNNAIQNVGMRLLSESLIKTKIRDLDLSGTAPSTSLQQITQWAMTRSGIELNLSNCNLIPRSINTIFSTVDGDRFQVLDLSYNTIDSDLADILMEWLPTSNISKLNLSGMRINESKILKALRLAKTVRSVVFERMGFGDLFGQNLGIGWSRGDLWHVKRWQLAFNKLTAKGLRACKEGGSIGSKKYRATTVTLECENNYIDPECIKDYQRDASHFGWEGVFIHFGNNQRSIG
ncbi:hypothetical protein HDV06_002598 [Boothiomyces sp. JEL0866]|nr:hypothetical protein HDV06_002598 [Boothiomyces sp. JEL0866]